MNGQGKLCELIVIRYALESYGAFYIRTLLVQHRTGLIISIKIRLSHPIHGVYIVTWNDAPPIIGCRTLSKPVP